VYLFHLHVLHIHFFSFIYTYILIFSSPQLSTAFAVRMSVCLSVCHTITWKRYQVRRLLVLFTNRSGIHNTEWPRQQQFLILIFTYLFARYKCNS